jgi:hypothetical protein
MNQQIKWYSRQPQRAKPEEKQLRTLRLLEYDVGDATNTWEEVVLYELLVLSLLWGVRLGMCGSGSPSLLQQLRLSLVLRAKPIAPEKEIKMC